MGMSSHVVGIKPPNDEYKKKLAAWKACDAAGVSVPQALIAFFGPDGPREEGVEVNLEDYVCCEKYIAEMRDGFTIDLEKIPIGVRFVRFYNSY